PVDVDHLVALQIRKTAPLLRLHGDECAHVVPASRGVQDGDGLTLHGACLAVLRVEVERVVRQRVIRADVDVVVEERYGLASRVDDLDAGMLAKGHRPIHVVAAARHVDGQRDVVLPFAESHPEEVGDGHLDGGLRLAIPETADDKLSLDLSMVSPWDDDTPPPYHARALMIDERE